ncbi:MAG: hypothetical protein JWO89_561 [Verrucomicrobiaceae bacterium]|nr:hypothetical protein [Verrucomicrobiaceae bacterium]
MNSSKLMKLSFLAVALIFIGSVAQAQSIKRVPVVFSEGHETEGVDRGRPVVLVAGALGVAPEVFREAFSHVHPAGAGERPEEGQVRENKAALMKALGKYGVTNDKLDAASNYYRYVRSRGELWPTKPAVANAVIQNGVATKIELVSGGSGYSSPPTVTVPGMAEATFKVQLAFNKKFEKNGSVAAITIVQKAK